MSVYPPVPPWLAIRLCCIALRPLQLAFRPLQPALRPLQLTPFCQPLDPFCQPLDPSSWRGSEGQPAGSEGQPGEGGRMDKQNFCPLYRTPSLFGLLPCYPLRFYNIEVAGKASRLPHNACGRLVHTLKPSYKSSACKRKPNAKELLTCFSVY